MVIAKSPILKKTRIFKIFDVTVIVTVMKSGIMIALAKESQ